MTQRQHHPESSLPDPLHRALREADRPDFDIPADVSNAIHAAARRKFESVRKQRRLSRWIPAWAAAAAAILLLCITTPLGQPAREMAKSRANLTILDAFSLARQLKAHNEPGREWDYNADGVVDRRDVDALARAAVRLEDGT